MSALAIVDAWARETEHRLRSVLRESAQDVAEAVSVGNQYGPGSPRDTGFLLSSWDATLGTPPSTPLKAPKGATAGQFSRSDSMALVISSADLGDTITVYNNTQYLPYLEDGSTTPKSPHVSGWIAQAVHQWPTIVAQAVARVRGSGRVS